MAKLKDYQLFRRIIIYSKLMKYDINDILKMSDNELRLWYKRTLKNIENESDFRIRTGLIIESQVNKELLSLLENRWSK